MNFDKPQTISSSEPIPTIKKVEAIQNVEQDFTPEHIEQIMAKVQDIQKEGTAYTVLDINGEDINLDMLGDVLNKGILGRENSDIKEKYKHLPKNERWAKATRDYIHLKFSLKNKNIPYWEKDKTREVLDRFNSRVDFNLNGRMRTPFSDDERNLTKSFWIRGKSSRVGILFDPAMFKQVSRGVAPQYIKQGEFIHGEKDRLTSGPADSEYGFSLFSRVKPRMFKGIFFRCATPEENQKDGKNLSHQYNDNFEDNKNTAEKILEIMKNIYKEKSQLMVPIYDVKGNLWWPKQMSYEEVKKYTIERDAQNANKEEK